MKINNFTDRLTKNSGIFDFYFLFLQKIKRKSFKVLLAFTIFFALILGYAPNIIENKTSAPTEATAKSFFFIMIFFISLVCYIFTIFLINITSTETIEEKNSRAMEIIISSISPKKHMFARIFSNFILFFSLFIFFLFLNFLATLIFCHTPDGILAFMKKFSGIDKNHSVFELYNLAKFKGNFIFFLLFSAIIIFITVFIYLSFAVALSSIPSTAQDSQYLMLPLIIIPIISFTTFSSISLNGSEYLKTIMGLIPLINLCYFPLALLFGNLANSNSDFYSIFFIGLAINTTFYYLVSYPLSLIYQQGILNYSQKAAWAQFKEVIRNLKYRNK